MAEPKTKLLGKIYKKYTKDDRHSWQPDANFSSAYRNITRVVHQTPYSLDVLSLIKADKILITEQGLR